MIVPWLTLNIVQPEQRYSQEQLPAFYFFLVDFVTSWKHFNSLIMMPPYRVHFIFSLDCSIPGFADTTVTPDGGTSCAIERLGPATQTLQQPKRARTVSPFALQGIFFGVSLQRLLTRSRQLPLSILQLCFREAHGVAGKVS